MKVDRYKVLALLAAPLAPQLRFKPLTELIAFAIEIKGAALSIDRRSEPRKHCKGTLWISEFAEAAKSIDDSTGLSIGTTP